MLGTVVTAVRDRPPHRRGAALLAAAVLLVLAACSGDVSLDGDEPEEFPTEQSRPVSVAREPDAQHTLVPSEDPAELAVAVSRAYLTEAQVAVLAPVDDRAAVLRASSLARATGAPVLLSNAGGTDLNTELLRLGVSAVVTIGAVDLDGVDTTSLVVAPAPDDVGALGDLFAADLTEAPLPDGESDDDVVALLDLGEGEVFAASDGAGDGGGDPSPSATGTMPTLEPAERVADTLVLTDGDPAQVAALGTAGGVGAQVLTAPADVRSSPEAIEAIHDAGASTVVGLGTSFGDERQFAWRTATAATGVQLPAGGQLVLPGARYVALYGSPITPRLGVLGEQDVPETIARAAQTAAAYDDLVDEPVVPALEIIVTVASGSAGDDGNYSQEWPAENFVPLIEAAAEAGQYVVLDFQPGRTSFTEQVQEYAELLEYPHVGVALDPEWRLGPDQVHLQQIGSVGIDEVNEVVDWVADFVQENRLPQKLVVLHQFQLAMIADRSDLDTSRSEVALLIHADGQGDQGAKQATWRALHEDAPEGVFWGWKNFVDEDSPMLTPEQTIADVDPVPDFVSYQ
jgi:hypothetical protein